MYLEWLERFRLVTFDFPSYVSIDCLVKKNYHDMLYWVASVAAVMISAIALQLLWAEVNIIVSWLTARFGGQSGRNNEETQDEQDVSKYFSACLVVSYLIYPSFTAGKTRFALLIRFALFTFGYFVLAVFSQTFNCREIDGVRL
jgi:hypothetical protein